MTTSRTPVLVCILALAFLRPVVGQAQEVWFWFSNCGAAKLSLNLNVKLDGRLLHSATVSICKVARNSDDSRGASRHISFRLKSDRSIKWEGYREDNPVTNAGHSLDVDLWQAGADPDALLIGVSVSDGHLIYVNTIHIAYPDKPSSTRLARGLVVLTRPATSER